MEEQILFEKIEAYLSDQLSPAERLAFEKELAQNPAWQVILQQHQEMEAYLNDPVAQSIEAGLAKVRTKSQPLYKQIPKKVYASAAAIVLLLLMLWGIGHFQANNNYQSLAMAQFEPYPSLIKLRGQEETKQDSSRLRSGLLLYESSDYEAAKLLFLDIENADLALKAQFYLGNIYLAQNQPQAAIEVLEKVIDSGDPLLLVQSRWYLALAYLQKPESKEQGIAFLEEVAQTETEFALKAQQLLKEIK
ncbi:MAG: tetratricopeptide repeat protein [Bacteroidota bacterium]